MSLINKNNTINNKSSKVPKAITFSFVGLIIGSFILADLGFRISEILTAIIFCATAGYFIGYYFDKKIIKKNQENIDPDYVKSVLKPFLLIMVFVIAALAVIFFLRDLSNFPG
jgi:hypothetical protein